MPPATENSTMNTNGTQTRRRIRVKSAQAEEKDGFLTAKYIYRTTKAEVENDEVRVSAVEKEYTLRTDLNVGKVGLMLVGIGGNNGTTVTASLIANRNKISWNTRTGVQESNFFGSVTQASTVRIGKNSKGEDVYVPLSDLLPMVDPRDLVIGGWDINNLNLADAMLRAQVFEYDFQRQLIPYLKDIVPLPSVYYPDFIAANQGARANNVLPGTKQEHLEKIRSDIREFKEKNALDKVIVLWTANTERFSDILEGVNDTADNLLKSIKEGHDEVSPSTIFAVASILEGSPFINGSPQNTFVPGCIELAEKHRVHIGGDDFKSGQTKMKSVLVDFLVSAGIKPLSITSYNHLGNNDGYNLSAPFSI